MMQQSLTTSYLFGSNAPYVEELYEAYLLNPNDVDLNWRQYFDALQHQPAVDGSARSDIPHAPIISAFAQRAKKPATTSASKDFDFAEKHVAVQQLVSAYRFLGSRWANLDPLQRSDRPEIPELDPAFYGLSETDMATTFNVRNAAFGSNNIRLRDLIQNLRDTYCRSVGVEYMHVSDPSIKRWLRERVESARSTSAFTAEQKIHILERLTAAEGLERFLHTKYVGQKRFSLEGGESFIVSIDAAIQMGGSQGVQEVIIGMAHRGRLNVLVNTLGKMPADLFAEFEGHHAEDLPAGDVKYHQGFSSDVATPGGPVHLSLAFNPSHLEIVNPVVEGSVKARQERRDDDDGTQVLPVLVHGDAAFAGQGVVMETLNLAMTRGYGTGGTLHIVINNQIGFTTSDPRDKGSTIYCSDVAKIIEAPVLHVNGDDPEAVVFVTQLAMDYRKTFKKDIVIDIVCFRKLGHNEQDTPAMTQPLMYKKIAVHPGTRKNYGDKLVAAGVLPASGNKSPDGMVAAYRAAMESGKHSQEITISNYKHKYAVDWSGYHKAQWDDACDTSIPASEIARLAKQFTTIPEKFTPHPLVAKVIADRAAMGRGDNNLDWGMGEHLAFSSLVSAGFPIRITGQDVGRGTFTHRHAVLHDQNRERFDTGVYIPLQNIAKDQAPFHIFDSVLSEEAVLGFEYGYASVLPNSLTIWEAQFGDFANGAQVVIDQFISSGQVKWGRLNGLVMMLPHGYEGQGPEHSSARLERYLQLCADNNMQVVQPTNAAQIFHVLRRQMLRPFRAPLIILTPKSLLRHKDAAMPLSAFTQGSFQNVIAETDTSIASASVSRVLLCSGKVYYDLVNARKEQTRKDVAIIRLEQIYPFPKADLQAILTAYSKAKDIVWVQDEPQNQGAWLQVQPHILNVLGKGQHLTYAGRPASASPAVGYYDKHYAQLKTLIEAAFA